MCRGLSKYSLLTKAAKCQSLIRGRGSSSSPGPSSAARGALAVEVEAAGNYRKSRLVNKGLKERAASKEEERGFFINNTTNETPILPKLLLLLSALYLGESGRASMRACMSSMSKVTLIISGGRHPDMSRLSAKN